MMTFQLNLSRTQIQKLTQQLNEARKRGSFQEYQRILAILSLSEGHTLAAVASILQAAISSVYRWLKQFLVGAEQGLQSRRSPGRPPKLTKKQKRTLSDWVIKGPAACGFSGSCWRTPMLQTLILQRWNVFYSVNYLSQLLKNLGFRYQKAAFVAAAQDTAAREKWLQQVWPGLLAKAKRQGAYLFFGDESSFPQWGTLSYTWALCGQQPLVKTSGNRRAYKLFGLIDYFTGKLFAKGHEGKLNAESYVEFLTDVLSKTRKAIYLVQDGAPYHRGKQVKAFFSAHQDRLTVYQLPAYSPDFNPIEGLWKKIKTEGTHLKYFPTFDSLVKKVEEMVLDFQHCQKEILNLFGFYTK